MNVHRCVRRAGETLVRAGIRNEPVVVAVSGGSDSMALLEIVALLAPKLDLALHVASIDHGMRAEAGGEIEAVRAAAALCGAIFHPAAIDPGNGDEDTLRRRRHLALEEIARASGCRFILLGHTREDQIETIVFRFLRGAGLGGLSGMREIRPPFVRPLLALGREDLRDVLRARGLAWFEDPSNTSDRYARGRLRSQVFPAMLRAFGQGALEHLLDVAPRWRADEDYLEIEAGRLIAFASRRGPAGVELDAAALAGAHPALRARVLRRWLAEQGERAPTSREIAVIESWLDESRSTEGGIDVAGARLTRARGRLALRGAGGRLPRVESFIDSPVLSDDALRSGESHEQRRDEEAEEAG
ncbi:MAG TPA: tRNA lysidine(34) synthetase TilS [Candidatus Limnocylindrales bacterium]|nr:tRNA lysidine(34) synthetase TilS [Candidatus Limnocylindrales bacterium]